MIDFDCTGNFSFDLQSLSEAPPDLYDYVMAPLQENVYARARVIKRNEKYAHYVFVHFIDEGYGAWMRQVSAALIYLYFAILIFIFTPRGLDE